MSWAKVPAFDNKSTIVLGLATRINHVICFVWHSHLAIIFTVASASYNVVLQIAYNFTNLRLFGYPGKACSEQPVLPCPCMCSARVQNVVHGHIDHINIRNECPEKCPSQTWSRTRKKCLSGPRRKIF